MDYNKPYSSRESSTTVDGIYRTNYYIISWKLRCFRTHINVLIAVVAVFTQYNRNSSRPRDRGTLLVNSKIETFVSTRYLCNNQRRQRNFYTAGYTKQCAWCRKNDAGRNLQLLLLLDWSATGVALLLLPLLLGTLLQRVFFALFVVRDNSLCADSAASREIHSRVRGGTVGKRWQRQEPPTNCGRLVLLPSSRLAVEITLHAAAACCSRRHRTPSCMYMHRWFYAKSLEWDR